MEWTHDDGGRHDAGFRGDAGDCVTRAIAIATGMPYAEVYRDLARLEKARGKPRSARNGVSRKSYEPYLEGLGWEWLPTAMVGSPYRVHLRSEELERFGIRMICRLSKHLTVVVDGVIHDTADPSREGTRMVYGVFVPGH